MKEHIPESYFDSRLEIVPSRLILLHKQAREIKDKCNSFLQTNWFWFTSPISECLDPKELGYVYGSCKNSETASKEILNLPCVHEEKYNDFLFAAALLAFFTLRSKTLSSIRSLNPWIGLLHPGIGQRT